MRRISRLHASGCLLLGAVAKITPTQEIVPQMVEALPELLPAELLESNRVAGIIPPAVLVARAGTKMWRVLGDFCRGKIRMAEKLKTDTCALAGTGVRSLVPSLHLPIRFAPGNAQPTFTGYTARALLLVHSIAVSPLVIIRIRVLELGLSRGEAITI